MPSRLQTHPFTLLVAASAFWGVGTVLSKLALDRGIPPVSLLAVEMGASSSVLLLTLLATTRFHPRIQPTPDLRRLVALGRSIRLLATRWDSWGW
jgi:drug/metabolite transporter (DMT)-like permease